MVLLSHALSFLQLCPAVAAAVPTPSVSVISEGEADFLSVTVNNASLRFLLSEIAARAGFEFIEIMPTERQVSVTYHKVPLDQAFKQILQHEKLSFLLIYRDRKSAKKLEQGPRAILPPVVSLINSQFSLDRKA